MKAKPVGFAVDIYGLKDDGESVEMLVYDEIGNRYDEDSATAKAVAKQLRAHPNAKQINVSVNSMGGAVYDALSIYNQLVQHPARVIVNIDGAALSAASIIAMAGDEIRMAENASFMIHDPWSFAMGAADDLRAEAKRLDKAKQSLVSTYAARTGNDPGKISEMMSSETWLTADEAKLEGFIDKVVPAKALAASIDISRFANAPDWVKGRAVATAQQQEHKMADDTANAQEVVEEEPVSAEVEEEEKDDEVVEEPADEGVVEEDEEKESEEEEPKALNKAQLLRKIAKAIPNASAAFLAECVEDNLSVKRAKALYAAATAGKPKAVSGGPGMPNNATAPKVTGSWLDRVKNYAAENKCTMTDAMSAMAKADPKGRERWIESQKYS